MARVLVIGPHPDDQELGMGATIARLAREGHEVLLLDVTNGEPTPHGSVEARAQEAAAAARILGVRRLLLGLPNRTVEHSIAARHAVAGVIRAWGAQIVFTPFFEDAHPDHVATTRIVEDARFDAKLSRLDLPDVVDGWGGEGLAMGPPVYPKWLFYYYATHLRWVANPSFIVDVTGFERAKLDSITAYHTQFVLPENNRRVVEWVRSSLDYMGSRIGVAGGEGFYSKEPMGVSGLLGGLVV